MLITYYQIQPGDSLPAIAGKYGTTPAAILAANRGAGGDAGEHAGLRPGRMVRVPVARAAHGEDMQRRTERHPDRDQTSSAIGLAFELAFGHPPLEQLLAVLARAEARATWFVTGQWAGRHRGELAAIRRAGHEVQNHGYDHSRLRGATREAVEDQVGRGAAAIRDACGLRTTYLRPPFGESSPTVVAAARRQGHRVIGPCIDSLDWHSFGPEVSLAHVTAGLAQVTADRTGELDGATVVCHATADNCLSLLRPLLATLARHGRRPVPVGDLAGRPGGRASSRPV